MSQQPEFDTLRPNFQVDRDSLAGDLLPQFVRSRLQTVPLLRRLVGQHDSARRTPPDVDQVSPDWSVLRSSASVQDDDMSIIASSRSSSSHASGTIVAMSEPSPSRASFDDVSFYAPEESKSGVEWKFAFEGCTLLVRALREASSPVPHPTLTRRLYLDGLAYLLRALPQDLDDVEGIQLQQSMPSQLDLPARRRRSMPDTLPVDARKHVHVGRDHHTTLYNLSARVTLAMLFVLHLVLPYVRVFISHIYNYERKCQMTERVVANGFYVGSTYHSPNYQYRQWMRRILTAHYIGSVWRRSINTVQQATEGIQDGLIQGATMAPNDKPAPWSRSIS